MEGDGRRPSIHLTPNGNNPLHVAAWADDSQSVDDILRDSPSLLYQKNTKDETPLHMAAREGHVNVVKRMIDRAKVLEEHHSGWVGKFKKMLRATNIDGDTALHMAARNCHLEEVPGSYLEVVQLLIGQDKHFEHRPNNVEETPLYLAAERGNDGSAIVAELMRTCTSLNYSGPRGRTALHAAAIKDFTGESIKPLFEWKEALISKADAYGWTPLHCAAWSGNAMGVKELLKMDISILHIKTVSKDGQALDTALHIAAARGHVPVLQELLTGDPNCWEMVNSEGQNILHIAVDMNKESVIQFILSQSWVRHLINQKDKKKGNTPLHLLVASDCTVKELWEHKKADQHAFNYNNMTPVDLVRANFKEGRRSSFAATYLIDDTFLDSGISGGRNIACDNLPTLEEEGKTPEKKREEDEKYIENIERQLGSIVIVAALIATITFAATFTIPGGYDPNADSTQEGKAILVKEAAFKAFVITNTIAMVCSVTSIFLCITASNYTHGGKDNSRMENRGAAALLFLLVSMFVVMAAFIAASFAVLARSLAVTVSICIIIGFSFILSFYELIKIISVYVSRRHEAGKK